MKNWMNVFTALAIISIVSWGCARTEKGAVVINSPGDEDESGHDHGDGDHEGHDHGDGDHEGHGDGDHAGHDHGDGDSDGHDHDDTVLIALYCGDCGTGVAKGAEHKCDPNGEACSKCAFHKGSALCCKIEGDFAGKSLCASCGQIKGSDVCCDKDAAVCTDCGYHKGSPLCCKIGPKEAPAEAPAAPEDTPPTTDEASPAPAPADAP